MTALIYSDSALADQLLRDIALHLMEQGWSLAGLVQHNAPRPGRSRCDMILEELSSGEHVSISQDRGPHARGCALDTGQLLSAMQMVRQSISHKPDLVILNKFGKSESEGAGFRPLLSQLLEAEIPVLIAVPWRNIESWRLFAGEYAVEHPVDSAPNDAAVLCRKLGLHPSEKYPDTCHPAL
ncbi:MAG: DUF2478 domain-containing protein [Beijerinckiaceae bacterium]